MTGIVEALPTEQDGILEDLIKLESEAERQEEEEKQHQASQAAEVSQQQAVALDI